MAQEDRHLPEADLQKIAQSPTTWVFGPDGLKGIGDTWKSTLALRGWHQTGGAAELLLLDDADADERHEIRVTFIRGAVYVSTWSRGRSWLQAYLSAVQKLAAAVSARV
ncbi:MAG: hypothetical protein ACYCW6_00185 [Candidatus Xenobia bacterium]